MIRLLCYTLSFVFNNLGNCKKIYQSSFKKLLDRVTPDMVLVNKNEFMRSLNPDDH